jgi:hypothetical protein
VKLGLKASSKTRVGSASLLGRYRLRKKHSFEFETPAYCQPVLTLQQSLRTLVEIHGGGEGVKQCLGRVASVVLHLSATERVSPTNPCSERN